MKAARALVVAWLAVSCERSVDDWSADLHGGNSFDRQMAAIALREAGDEELPRVLMRLAVTSFDHDDAVRLAARESLVHLRDAGRLVPEVSGFLVRSLEDHDPMRRLVAAMVLAYFVEADERMLEGLAIAAEDTHPSVRFHAVEALRVHGGPGR